MIYVDRSRIDAPSILSSDRVEKEKLELNAFYSQNAKKKQVRYRFKNRFYSNREIKQACNDLFYGKCAYCESVIDTISSINIDHFRPKQHAMNLDGSVNRNHYWWLAYEWNNLYSSCEVCNQNKKTRFPIEGKRVLKNQALTKEKTLLIDPCNGEDFYDTPFRTMEDGSMLGETRKGKITIDIFKLNRPELCQARKRVIDHIYILVKEASQLNDAQSEQYFDTKEALIKMLKPESPHASVSIYYTRLYAQRVSPSDRVLFQNLIEDSINQIEITQSYLKQELPKEKSIDELNQIASEFEKKISYNLNLDSIEEKEAYFTSSKKIQKIEILNFKIIQDLTLNFPKSVDDQEPWMVLLGENGAGKSSVLQAIALALAGEKLANSLGLDASRFVNHDTRKKKGYVKVYLEGIAEPCELHFNTQSELFTSNFQESKVILLAFGSTRLMGDNLSGLTDNTVRNLKNLFNPFATLPDVEEWISNPGQVSVTQFDQIAIELKSLLQLPEDKLIYRRKTKSGKYELFIKTNKEKHGIRVRELSAGYQAILVMTLNIIRELLTIWDTFSIAEGIVLIDEIGVHLHPKWKLQIISTLRGIFPALNFIITTHEPLCLRGVNEGEVVLMKMNEDDKVISLVDLPSPKGLTVEQLITSKFFGLITSFDPEVEAQLNSLYLLSSKRNPTQTEQNQLATLREELEDMNIIDDQEQLEATKSIKMNFENSVLDAGWVANPKHQEDLKKKIREIWAKKSL